MYSHAFVLASALVAGAAAQSTTVTSLNLYGFEGQNIVASVISAAPEATTYFVNCAPGTDGSDCGFGPGVTFVNGPSTVGAHLTEVDAITMDTDCKITGEIANCVQTVAGPEANDPTTTTGEIAATDLSMSLEEVTITAGLEKILAVASATGTGSSAASSTAAEPSSSAASGASETGSSSATRTSTSASSTSSSSSTATNGAVAVSGQNLIVAAGLSGVLGLMMAM